MLTRPRRRRLCRTRHGHRRTRRGRQPDRQSAASPGHRRRRHSVRHRRLRSGCPRTAGSAGGRPETPQRDRWSYHTTRGLRAESTGAEAPQPTAWCASATWPSRISNARAPRLVNRTGDLSNARACVSMTDNRHETGEFQHPARLSKPFLNLKKAESVPRATIRSRKFTPPIREPSWHRPIVSALTTPPPLDNQVEGRMLLLIVRRKALS